MVTRLKHTTRLPVVQGDKIIPCHSQQVVGGHVMPLSKNNNWVAFIVVAHDKKSYQMAVGM
jgi:hypothetical protein